jgi:hypothetical protein
MAKIHVGNRWCISIARLTEENIGVTKSKVNQNPSGGGDHPMIIWTCPPYDLVQERKSWNYLIYPDIDRNFVLSDEIAPSP